MLWQYFSKKQNGTPSQTEGALAFFGIGGKVSHIGYHLSPDLMISAAGGGSKCITREASKAANAFVKIQPIAIYRTPAYIGSFLPKYSF